MKTEIKTHSDLHIVLNKTLPKITLSKSDLELIPNSRDKSIIVLVTTAPSSSAKGIYADSKEASKSKNVTYLSVRSNNRALARKKVEKCLQDLKINYTEENKRSLGTKGGLSISLNNKTVKIVFKFRNGLDKIKFEGWNEMMHSIFEHNPDLKKAIPTDRNEREKIEYMNKIIGENEDSKPKPVLLIIGNKKFKNVAGFVGDTRPQKDSKSDFTIINVKGEQIGWISYKSGKTATSFQQYSGITRRSQLDRYSEIKEFEKKIQEDESISKESDTSYWYPIKDTTLKQKAVFGYEYGRKSGPNNVDFLIQGDIKLLLNKSTRVCRLTSPGGLVVKKGDVNKLKGDYEPTIGTRSARDRRYLKLESARGGIWTRKFLTNRKNNKNLSLDSESEQTPRQTRLSQLQSAQRERNAVN